jgi:hypothetical protein
MKKATCLLGFLFLLFSSVIIAQEVTVEEEKAAQILDDFVEASGGIEAHDKIKNRYTEATMSMPDAGIEMKIKSWSAKPDKSYSIAKSEAIGEFERGYNGEVFWEKSVMTGPRIIEGDELVDAKFESRFDKYIYWRDTFDKVAYAGQDSVNGELCEKVVVTLSNGDEQTLFFNQDSNLLVKIEASTTHQMGEIPLEIYIEDYRTVDDILTGYRSRTNMVGQRQIITTDSMAHNVDLPDDIFALPEDIKQMVEAKDTTESE